MLTRNRGRACDRPPYKSPPKRGLDVSSAILLIIGVISGIVAFRLVQHAGVSVFVMVPSMLATLSGALNLTTIKGAR